MNKNNYLFIFIYNNILIILPNHMAETADNEYNFGDYNNQEKEKFCFTCSKVNIHLLKCGNCKSIYYCSKECQKSNWTDHKKICKYESDIITITNLFTTLIKRGVSYFKVNNYNKYKILDMGLYIETQRVSC